MIRVEESNMIFEFDEQDIYQIEESLLHKSFGNNIKTVEFVVSVKPNDFRFIEAKSSSPNPTNETNFKAFIEDICEKFIHSFNMFLAAYFKRADVSEMPTKLLNMKATIAKFNFILIIYGHRLEWLPPLKSEFEKILLYHQKIWGTNIILLNEELAKEMQLIVSYK